MIGIQVAGEFDLREWHDVEARSRLIKGLTVRNSIWTISSPSKFLVGTENDINNLISVLSSRCTIGDSWMPGLTSAAVRRPSNVAKLTDNQNGFL